MLSAERVLTAEQRRRFGRVNAFLLRFVRVERLDEDRLRSALITAAVACLFAVIAPAYALLIWLFERPPAVYYALALEAFVTATSALLLLRRGFLRSAPWVLLVGGGIAVLVPFLREGASSQAAGNFTIVTVMAALLVGWRGVLLLGIPSTIAIVLVGVLADSGRFVTEPTTSTHGVFALMQMLSLIVMLVIFDRVRLGILQAQYELEAKLREAQRLEAVGRLAGGIAHDFNNLLTVILANASVLSERTSEKLPEVDEIRAASERAAQLTRQLLAFSRRQKLSPRVFDLVALLGEEKSMLRRLIPETIRLVVTCPPSPLFIDADPGQISQVILNLAVNARDAMPQGGVLSLALTRVDEPRDHVCLSVTDTGSGMDSATLARAFEPFFTTKGPFAGTGLGLATVHGIVTQSGGQVRVKSGTGLGTSFSIYLPESSPPPVVEPPSEAVAIGPSARCCTILLIEDDESVQSSTARVLRSSGHRVLECSDAHGARECFRVERNAIDVVLSDVILPGASGPELVDELLASGPLRVLFVSGYLDDALKQPLLARAPFLAKPFTHRELEAKLQEVLAAPPVELR